MLEDHAEEHGVVEREGKLQIPALVWTFVFGFAGGKSRTLAAFRRSYNSTADKTLTAGGFYQRLTPQLAEFSGAPRRTTARRGCCPSHDQRRVQPLQRHHRR